MNSMLGCLFGNLDLACLVKLATMIHYGIACADMRVKTVFLTNECFLDACQSCLLASACERTCGAMHLVLFSKLCG